VTQAARPTSVPGTPASSAALTASTPMATNTAVGHSRRNARLRTHTVHVSPRTRCDGQDRAFTYPPTKKNTGMTWNTKVAHGPQEM
jgi:hypothetical protein